MKKLFVILIFISNALLAQQWQAVPLVTKSIKDAGNFGGEGCQVVQAIEIDGNDGLFLLMGTDVGGIYRSLNGGKIWEPCNVGYNPRGNCGFAIDPNNNHRALAVGGNSSNNDSHGLYLTTDQASTWKHVFKEGNYRGYRGYKDKVAFDRSSFDAHLRYSKLAYWSNPAGGLFKSDNGGGTWTQINTDFGDCILTTSPANGTIYIGNDNGLTKSIDGGLSFKQTFAGVIRDIAVVNNYPSKVWITTPDKLYVSNDEGNTFSAINTTGYPGNVITLAVSPANKDHIVVCQRNGQYNNPVYFSKNGGITWQTAETDNTNAFMPFNGRTQKFAWHPNNENKIWAFGGDWISSSKDGGKGFAWDANGYNGILVGGIFCFNIYNPDILFIASQDYNGAVTFDGGSTWKYCNASVQSWGGFTYGAYAANKDVLVTKVAKSWHGEGVLAISHDGGDSFVRTELNCTGLEVASGDPKDSNVIYFSNLRSTDLGNTWNEMNGCKGVFIANLYGDKEIFGGNGNDVVKSNDKGVTWQTVVSMPSKVADVAFDHKLNCLYIVVSGYKLFKYEKDNLTEITETLPSDQYGNKTVKSVAVDPIQPEIIYAAGSRNAYSTDVSVVRSNNSGKSWEILTRNSRFPNEKFGKDGAREAFAVRVNPKTRELWAAGGCYGVWKIGKPKYSEK